LRPSEKLRRRMIMFTSLGGPRTVKSRIGAALPTGRPARPRLTSPHMRPYAPQLSAFWHETRWLTERVVKAATRDGVGRNALFAADRSRDLLPSTCCRV